MLYVLPFRGLSAYPGSYDTGRHEDKTTGDLLPICAQNKASIVFHEEPKL